VFVPTEAIVPVAKGKKVYVVKDGLALEKIVETGIRTADYLQVLSGLAPGDSVIIKGNFQLKNETAVKISKKKANKV
jgi:membrane fusion protein (multidrug efflux system)